MGIFDRLGTVLKSYMNDMDNDISMKYGSKRGTGGDPDLDAAYDELNDYLGKNDTADKSGGKASGFRAENQEKEQKERAVPAELRSDFSELGLGPDATAEECKAAYKKLLKLHHPDRHAGHEGNMKKATEKTARINASYKRLERWFQLNR